MHWAMAISAGLCLLQGVYPQALYALLPHPPVEFHPWAPYHVLQALLLLGFTGLGFLLMAGVLKPHAQRNLDFEALYILLGRGFVAVVSWPLERLDLLWSEVYRVAGLRALLLQAGWAAVFDRQGIDTVVDGTACATRDLGRAAARMQTGRLQDYLAMAVVAGLLVVGIILVVGS